MIEKIVGLPRRVPKPEGREWVVVDRTSFDPHHRDTFDGFMIAEREDPNHILDDDIAVRFPREIALEIARAIAEQMVEPRPAVPVGPERGAVTPHNLAFLAELPKGWAVLWLDLLHSLPADYEVAWAKEKLGGLRVSPIGEHATLLNDYDARAQRTCAVCGAPAAMKQRDGFYLPHCVPCAVLEGFDEPDHE